MNGEAMARAPIARRRTAARCLTLVAVSACLALPGWSPAGAAPAMTLDVAPNGGLVPGQWVTASWTGVPQGSPVGLRQCSEDPQTIRDCSYLGAGALHSGGIALEGGTGWTTFAVAGVVNRADATDRFTCDRDDPCSIAMFTDASATDLDAAVLEPIRFALSNEGCPDPTSTDVVVTGEGTFSVSRAMRGWQGTLCRPPRDLHVRLRTTSSPRGEDAFVAEDAAFAMTSQPFSGESVRALRDDDRSFTYAPIVGSGLVFGFRMVDAASGEPITQVRLTPGQLAQIFTGQLRDLGSDPDVAAQNPGVAFPPVIQAIGRSDASAQTRLLTSWFLARARPEYRAGGHAFDGGPTETYPKTGAITLVSGARSVASNVADPDVPNRASFGTIGWMDSSVAALYGLPTVRVENPAGEFVAPTSASLAAGIRAMRSNGDGVTRSPRFDTRDAKAYPLPVVTYMAVQTNATADFDDTEADVLRGFIRLAASDADRAGSLPPGYAALPSPMIADARRAAELMPTTEYSPPGAASGDGGGFTDGGFTGDGGFGTGGGVDFPSGDGGGTGGGGSQTPDFGDGSATPTPSASGSLAPGPDVLPPTALVSANDEYAWPVLVIGAVALIVLGTVMSFALRMASRQGAKRALAEAGRLPEPADPTIGR